VVVQRVVSRSQLRTHSTLFEDACSSRSVSIQSDPDLVLCAHRVLLLLLTWLVCLVVQDPVNRLYSSSWDCLKKVHLLC